MPTTFQRWGNSLGVRVPKELADKLGVRPGTVVEWALRGTRLVLTPVPAARPSLRALLKRVTPKNLHGAVETGEPVGRESW